jgi:hypothetical protein
VYASVRQYRTKDNAEVARRAREEFVPIAREIPGFSAYYIVDAGESLLSITVGEDRESVERSVDAAREWVQKTVADLIDGPPTISNGEWLADS